MADIKKITLYIILSVFLISGCAVPRKRIPWQNKTSGQIISARSIEQSVKTATSATGESRLPDTTSLESREQKPALKERKIKIGIVQNSESIAIGGPAAGITVFDNENNAVSELPGDSTYRAVVANGGISFANRLFGSGVKITSKEGDCWLTVDGQKYRGNILLIKAKNGITAINEVGIEEYICGIITKEISASWAVESIKAQAVVARTYAVKNIDKHKHDGFDLCDKQHCQVYGGMNAEDPVSDKAVYDTAGEVLFYEGKVANTFYHSSCGGRTENASNVWQLKNDSPDYLKGVKCGFCETEPWHNWRFAISLSDIAAYLKSAGFKIKKIKNIQTSGRTSSGRVKYVLIKHTGSRIAILSHKFRMLLGSETIRSTNFKVMIKNGTAYFEGHGWGHGVGMCQWGAKGMAERGRDYEDILKHYYPGCDIRNYE